MIVTQGKHGCVTYERGGRGAHHSGGRPQDRGYGRRGRRFSGGDAPLVAAGAPMNLVGFIGNVVGALKVEIVGHRHSIEKAALIKGVTGLLK